MKTNLSKEFESMDDEDWDEDEDEKSLEDMYLVFNCDSKEYAIEIKYVIQIVAFQPITEIPDLPAYIAGVINLRGKIFPVIDVRLRFNLEKKNYSERTCFVIASMNESTIGMVVDSVNEVVRITEENIEPAPKMGKSVSSRFVRGIGKVG
jgi:purine-binding chemotaxis protein CheW